MSALRTLFITLKIRLRHLLGRLRVTMRCSTKALGNERKTTLSHQSLTMEPCAWYNAGSQSVLIEYHMNSKKQNQKTT